MNDSEFSPNTTGSNAGEEQPAIAWWAPFPHKPIRFVTIEWREDWEFDHPTALIEPVVRYSPNGNPPESMIEDAAIDIVCDMDQNVSTPLSYPGDAKEFAWRGWDLEKIRAVAESYLKGDKVPFGTGYVCVVEQYVTFFYHSDEGWIFDFDDEKEKAVESS